MVVLAYASWCPFSQQLLPVFGNVSMAFPTLSFLRIDGDREWRFSSRYMIRGFPSILVFRNGKVTDHYDGERTTKGLFEFFESLSGESPVLQLSELEISAPDPQGIINWYLVFSYAFTVAFIVFKSVQLWRWYRSEVSAEIKMDTKVRCELCGGLPATQRAISALATRPFPSFPSPKPANPLNVVAKGCGPSTNREGQLEEDETKRDLLKESTGSEGDGHIDRIGEPVDAESRIVHDLLLKTSVPVSEQPIRVLSAPLSEQPLELNSFG